MSRLAYPLRTAATCIVRPQVLDLRGRGFHPSCDDLAAYAETTCPRMASDGRTLAQWAKLVARARAERLDADEFAKSAVRLSSKGRLQPVVIVDLLLRPTARDHHLIDPRMPENVQVLHEQKLVDSPAILQVLYTYSSVHSLVPHAAPEGQGGRNTDTNAGEGSNENTRVPPYRWTDSYNTDERFFWRLTKGVALDTTVRTSREAFEVLKWMVRWMELFNHATAVFSAGVFPAIQHFQARDQKRMEECRVAFAHLLLNLFEHHLILSCLGMPNMKGRRIRGITEL